MSGQGHDAKFFQRGKIQVCMVTRVQVSRLLIRPFQEFRQELQAAETKDKKYTKRKTILKKIVANITMGNDSSCRDPAGARVFAS
jgi:AP-2 complex subunit beta-1